MNGTTVIETIISSYSSKELAEKAKIALEDKNKEYSEKCFPIVYEIQEGKYFENEDDVEILKEE